MPILNVQNLIKIYHSGFWPFKRSQHTVVNNISFELNKGEILGFLGPNGAGKTTTIQMLLGTLTPSVGSITYFGKDFSQHRTEILKKIGYASGYDKLPARLTVYENIDIVARIYGIKEQTRTERITTILRSFNLFDMRHRQVGSLSAGQTTRVLLAKAFIADPEIVLLDEPTASLDPDVAQEVRQFILKQRNERGTSILITSHNMDEVTELCDRIIVLKDGTIIANDTPKTLAATISTVRLHLNITSGLDILETYLNTHQLIYHLEEALITINIDEHAIAAFLTQLHTQNIVYSHISIDKPTLEDYFLHITKKGN